MSRNLALELVRVTETAALASARYMGRGDKNGADGAAVEGMRLAFQSIDIDGEVVIGEGELDEAPMLYIGEKLGTGRGMKTDVAVDPLEGTSLIAKGLPNSIAVLAMAEKGCLLKAPDTYMKKIVVGPEAKGAIDITDTVANNILKVSKALDKRVSEVTIMVQDRERHQYIIDEARAVGARIKVFSDGDIAAALAACFEETGVDIFMGIGGAPEGVITAAAVKCLGGDMQACLNPLSEEEIKRCREMGFDDEKLYKILLLDDLAKGDEIFFAATGITSGDLLKGVVYLKGDKAKTHSIVMRSKTGTVRFVEAYHKLDKNSIMTNLMDKYREI